MTESLTMHRTAYEQRTLAVLKAVACSANTIEVGDLAFAINYQRVTRPITDMLAVLRPILEDGRWPPLTCLVMGSNHQPVLSDDVLPLPEIPAPAADGQPGPQRQRAVAVEIDEGGCRRPGAEDDPPAVDALNRLVPLGHQRHL